MSWLGSAIAQSIVAFIATNIDDILILLLFFSQVDANFRLRHIFIGQYLGFSAIVIASLPGFFGGLVVRQELIGLLGILPIVIGIKQLVNKEEEATEVQTITSSVAPSPDNPVISLLLSILHPRVYKVAAVTLANGGDNIGVYIPLFAGNNLARLSVIIGVFFVMVGVWCLIAYLLASQAAIANILTQYGSFAVPFVLIGLGIFILYERGTFSLLPWVS